MDSIRVFDALMKADALINPVLDDITKQEEFKRQSVLANESLTKKEKSIAIKILNRNYCYLKVLLNKGKKRGCENCKQECFATLFCEHCVRNHLKVSNWTSGNDEIDDLIKKCQMETLRPDKVVEWIPDKNLQNIKYLTKGGCSEIYTADWIDGRYIEWDSNKQQLKRSGTCQVILKRLENVESANRNWFEEVNIILNPFYKKKKNFN